MALRAGDGSAATPLAQRITIHPDARTGRLVRSVVVAPRQVIEERPASETLVVPHVVSSVIPASERFDRPIPFGIDEAVEQIAAQQSLPAQLIHSVIKVESNYNPYAVSPRGAQGLMQLVPSTARRFGVSDAFNPVENIQGGAKYLKYLLDLYDGNQALALAAYNAGEGAVAKYGNVPPYAETQNYVQSVAQQLKKANQGAARPKKDEVKPAGAPPADIRHIQEIRQPDGTVRYVLR